MTSHSPDRIEGAPLIRPSTTDHPLYDDVVKACRTVFDPEIPVNIYDLGLVYTVEIIAGKRGRDPDDPDRPRLPRGGRDAGLGRRCGGTAAGRQAGQRRR